MKNLTCGESSSINLRCRDFKTFEDSEQDCSLSVAMVDGLLPPVGYIEVPRLEYTPLDNARSITRQPPRRINGQLDLRGGADL